MKIHCSWSTHTHNAAAKAQNKAGAAFAQAKGVTLLTVSCMHLLDGARIVAALIPLSLI